MRAKKSLGQNFLKSEAALQKIIGAGELGPKDTILEIGPGKGVLTERLLVHAGKVIAVEKDRELVEFLKTKFEKEIGERKLILVNDDILNFSAEQNVPERSSAQAGAPSKANFQQKIMCAEQVQNLSLPRPMLHSKNLDFSFSGLKTAVLYLIRDIGPIEKLSEKTKAQIAFEFENAAIECLVHKTAKAIEKYKIKTLIVAGGVSANKYLKKEMEKKTRKKIKLFCPTQELTGDNSLMIGIGGYLNYIKNKKKLKKASDIKATGNLRL